MEVIFLQSFYINGAIGTNPIDYIFWFCCSYSKSPTFFHSKRWILWDEYVRDTGSFRTRWVKKIFSVSSKTISLHKRILPGWACMEHPAIPRYREMSYLISDCLSQLKALSPNAIAIPNFFLTATTISFLSTDNITLPGNTPAEVDFPIRSGYHRISRYF